MACQNPFHSFCHSNAWKKLSKSLSPRCFRTSSHWKHARNERYQMSMARCEWPEGCSFKETDYAPPLFEVINTEDEPFDYRQYRLHCHHRIHLKDIAAGWLDHNGVNVPLDPFLAIDVDNLMMLCNEHHRMMHR